MADWPTLLAVVRVEADVDITDVSDDEITKALKRAYLEVLADEPWPFLTARATFTSTSGQAEYDVSVVAADCEGQRIQRVQTDGIDLTRFEAEDYYIVNPEGSTATSGGKTRWWTTLEASTLALWPPPGANTVRVIYTKTPDVATGTAWPERYDYAVLAGALVYVFQKIGDFDSAEVKKREFSDGARAVRADAIKPPTASPRFYGGGPTYRWGPFSPHRDWQYDGTL